MTDYKLVLSTAGSKEEAHKIARGLVERKLAACVNVVSQVESVYRWRGEIEEAQEYLLLIKTLAISVDRVCDAIRQLHSYEVPEAIAVAIDDGIQQYLAWISESVE